MVENSIKTFLCVYGVQEFLRSFYPHFLGWKKDAGAGVIHDDFTHLYHLFLNGDINECKN